MDQRTQYFALEYVLAGLNYCIALRFIKKIYDRMKEKSADISEAFGIYIATWAVIASTAAPTVLFTAVWTWPLATSPSVGAAPLFWTNIVPLNLCASIPVAVFFLTVGRCICLWRPLSFNRRLQRRLSWLTLFAMALTSGMNIVEHLMELPLKERTNCLVYSCLLVKRGVGLYQGIKVFWGMLNMAAGGAFLYMLRKYAKSKSQESSSAKAAKDKRTNRMAVLAIANEFCLNFGPQFIALVVSKTTSVNFGNFAGPYTYLTVSIDCLVFSMVYSRTLVKICELPKKANVQIPQKGPSTEPIAVNIHTQKF